MGKLKYSFIIPVYNCERYLEECISSIQEQNLIDNYEIVLVDDGSVDGSSGICDRYAEQCNNVQVFHKDNGGASSARNYGIEHAQGEYLLFIDGDDTLDKRLISHLEQGEISEEVLIIYGMSFDYYSGDRLERTEILTYPESGYIDREQLKENFRKFFECNSLSSACNKVFSKKIIDEYHIRFDESMNLYEDFEFVLRYLLHVKKLYCIKEGYYHYRLLKKEGHLKSRVKDLQNIINVLEKVGHSIDALEMGHETFVSLYLQLVYLHLLYTTDLKKSIGLLMQKMQEDKLLQPINNDTIKLGDNERQLLQYIRESKSKKLNQWINNNRFRMKIKNVLRPFVRVVRKIITK